MIGPDAFIVSTEEECLTTVGGEHDAHADQVALLRLMEHLRALAPSIPGGSGFFNGYGRCYVDCGHLEIALAECESPYRLAQVRESQHLLIARAVAALAREGCHLRLANNNHGGLLGPDAPTWGAHENYLVEHRPHRFTGLILPFLVTRVYQGAGGVRFPTGEFLLAARPEFMELPHGGSTTDHRAIHSTCRDDSHMGRDARLHRYHVILGDGHRSQFNLALQFGATALALKAVMFDLRLRADLERVALPRNGDWIATLRQFNLLARPGEPPRVDEMALDVQRIYLEAAARYADRLSRTPDWVPRILDDWDRTLRAMAEGDRGWLAARLDAFAKYELLSAALADAGRTWADLPSDRPLFAELALLDQSYHSFCDPDSVFTRLEEAGVLEHRVAERVEPGSEPEPYVPAYRTRARARARFISAHGGDRRYYLDWAWLLDRPGERLARLEAPFQRDFGPWTQAPEEFGALFQPPRTDMPF